MDEGLCCIREPVLCFSAAKPYPYYVGVDTQTNEYTYMTKNLLLYFLGDDDNSTTSTTKDHCSNKNNQVRLVLW